MADAEKKAQDLMLQADKKIKSSGGLFGGMFGGSSKTEEAAEIYVKAGNNFKMAKNWAGGGDAFTKAASVYMKMDHKHEAATQYIEAGNCFRKIDPNEAVKSIQKAIEIFTDMGRFTVAAKHHITIAEICETETTDLQRAMTNYEQAADYYKGEESSSSANKCLLKVAQYAAQLEQYEKAISIYEQVIKPFNPNYALKRRTHAVAQSSMDNQLLRYGAKDHFFRAALCRMCVDLQDASTSLTKYEDMFPTLTDCREIKLVKALLTACEEQNADDYSNAVRDYDAISRLDQWCTTILLRIKKTIEGESALR